MKKILTGLKPTGDLTLGNYIGSIKLMKELDKFISGYNIFFSKILFSFFNT